MFVDPWWLGALIYVFLLLALLGAVGLFYLAVRLFGFIFRRR